MEFGYSLLNLIIRINKQKINIKGGVIIVELIKEKVIISGNIVEFFQYEKGYFKSYELNCSERENKGRLKGNISNDYSLHRQQVLKRARTNLRRIINSNVGQYGPDFTSKFLTLTFRKDINDLNVAHYEFKKFIIRLNYKVYGVKESNLKYSAVPEFTKKGRVHYHIIFYNLPYLKANYLESIWGNGFIKINAIDNVNNVGAYICKYMTINSDDERLRGRKCYFNSRGLFEPTELTEKRQVIALRDALPADSLSYSSTFENEYLGEITYRQFNLSKL